jgi:tripartite-type tricarboxylate transporter receptor subunit TctC
MAGNGPDKISRVVREEKHIRQRLARWVPYASCLALGIGSAAALPAATGTSDLYPSKPIRVIVGTSPSGGTDFVARIMGQKLADAFGPSVVIDNRPGATGLIGMEIVGRAAPDGYTLLILNVGHLMAGLLRDASFDLTKELLPASLLASTPVMLVMHPSVAARTLPEFLALAKLQPGKINYASGGIGGVQHLATELLKREAGIDILHVPYKGTGPGLVDLLAGQVQITLTSVPSVLPYAKAGRLRAVAVSGKARLSSAPDVPTFAESGLPGVDVVIWYGLLTPLNTPRPIVDKLAGTLSQIAKSPEVQDKMVRDGADPIGGSPAEFAKYVKSEREKWLKVLREIGLQKN